MKKFVLCSLVLIIGMALNSTSFAQIGMNQWRVHFSANSARGIAKTESMIYMACANGIIRNDLEDNSIDQLTVTNGLSDLGISAIGGDNSVIIVGYVNGNLDIIEGNVITNVPWIKTAEISGDKSVHNFYFEGDLIYVCTGIGLVVFDNLKKEIRDTYYPYSDPDINDVTIYNDTIYAATENGVYFAGKNMGFLNDYNNWTKKTDFPPSVVNTSFKQIEVYQDKLFMGYDDVAFQADTVYYMEDYVLKKMPGEITLKALHTEADKFIITTYSTVKTFDVNLDQTGIIFEYQGLIPEPSAAVFDGTNYWISDYSNGLIRAKNSFDATSVYSNTPANDGCYKIDIQYGKVLVAGGGISQNLVSNSFRNGVYLFEDETWTNFNYKTDPLIVDSLDRDFISVAINPNNTDEFAFSSFSRGGIKIVKDGKTISEVYDGSNSVLETQGGDYMFIADMKYDDEGNLWVLNKGLNPLKVFTATGEQYAYSFGGAGNDRFPIRLLIDDEGNKWVSIVNVGLFAFNENGTFGDTSDDDLRLLSSSEGSGNLPHNFVNTIAQDADGEIWIGTEEGLVILYSRELLYDGGFGDFDASPILLEIGTEVERLLGVTNITSIAIDGGNRKWIGTSSSGVFCFSEDGTEEIYRFTEDNSPLISNNILDIAVDQLSGEVYFATSAGLVSFRSDATLADNDFTNVTVYPNPVRPEFAGPVTISGLGYESDVKVTDISGNLIFQTVSNGGTVIWDGKTLQGDRVQSGVYLVWSGITNGKGKNVAKILFIN